MIRTLLKTFLSFITLFTLFTLFPLLTKAQLTTISAVYTTGSTSSGSSSAGMGITFSIQNTNSSDVILRGIDYQMASGTQSWELWYSSTSLIGNPGAITAARGWTQVAAPTPITVTTAGRHPVISGINFIIPGNTTYRFALVTSHSNISYYSNTAAPNTFSAIGVNLLVGNYGTNVGYAGQWQSTTWAFNPRAFNGAIKVEPGQPCTNPPVPGTVAVSDTVVCANERIELSLMNNTWGTGQTFQWQYSTDNINFTNIGGLITSSNFVYNIPNTGYFRCALVCNNGTPVYSNSQKVTVVSPQIYSVTDTATCGSGIFTLYADVDSNVIVKWYEDSTSTTPIFTGNPFVTNNIANSRVYYAEASTSNNTCPSAKVRSTITIIPAPDLELGSNIDICVNENHIEYLDARNPGATYVWDNNYNGRVRTVTQSGTYHVAVTNSFGCTSYDTINVTFKQNPKSALGRDTSVCIDQEITLNAGNDGVRYYWNTGTSTPTITTKTPGEYIVFITGRNGCILTDTVTVIHQGNMPKFDGIQITNQGSHTFKFNSRNPQNVIGYEWNFGDGSPTSFVPSPTHQYNTQGNYKVTLHASSSCGVLYDSMMVHIYSLNVDDLDQEQASILVYPNPAKSYITVQASDNVKINQVVVMDINGRMVIHHKDLATQTHPLDITSLSAGQYIVETYTEKGKTSSKFIKE